MSHVCLYGSKGSHTLLYETKFPMMWCTRELSKQLLSLPCKHSCNSLSSRYPIKNVVCGRNTVLFSQTRAISTTRLMSMPHAPHQAPSVGPCILRQIEEFHPFRHPSTPVTIGWVNLEEDQNERDGDSAEADVAPAPNASEQPVQHEFMNRNARRGKRANAGKRPCSRQRRRSKKRAFGNHRR